MTRAVRDKTLYAQPDCPGKLALNFAADAITLMERGPASDWLAVSEARLGAEDFKEQIDTLRVQALVRDPAMAPVTLLLPDEQVIEMSLRLKKSGPDRFKEARMLLDREIGHGADDLSVILGEPWADGSTPVLGALTQTVREARAYAERWGFTAGAVTSQLAQDYGDGGRLGFQQTPPKARKATPKRLWLAAAAAAACLVMGVGAYVTTGEHASLLAVYTPEGSTAPRLPATVSMLTEKPTRPLNLAPVQIRQVQNLSPLSVATRGQVAVPSISGIPQAGPPAAVAAPDDAPPIRVGTSLQPFVAPKVARLEVPTPTSERSDIDHVLAALSTVRAAGQPLNESEAEVAEETRPEEADADSGTDSEQIASLDPTVRAPQSMTLAPSPRPVIAKPEPAPNRASEPDATDQDQSAADGAGAGSLFAVAPSDQIPETEPASDLAAREAPVPTTRPALVRRNAVARAPNSVRSQSRTAPELRAAADQTGLDLSETSLIGVLQARSGRQALIRTPAGDFRKLARGDVLEGWRVKSISRDAVQLTKQGRNRTLLLVSR